MPVDATLLLLSCQQAPFVETATRSLLEQRDTRLRVVLSDDGSTDGSWEIITRLAKEYRGPHQVEARRNPDRAGLVEHVNSLLRDVATDLVLLAASDDHSRPDRAARLLDAWRAAGAPKAYLTSDARLMDERGEPGERLRANPPPPNASLTEIVDLMGGDVLGCSSAFHRDVWAAFGPLTVSYLVEDKPLAFRAAGLDGILHVPEPLVDYRVHPRNLSQRSQTSWLDEAARRRRWNFQVQIFGQFAADLAGPVFSSKFGLATVAAARQLAQRRCRRAQWGLDYLDAHGWPRWKLIVRAGLLGRSPRRLLGWSWETLTRSRSSVVATKP